MIRLLLVDSRHSIRDVMAAVLRDELDMTVVGFASTVVDALAQLGRCNVVLVSSGLPDDGACQLLAEVARLRSGVKVVPIDVPCDTAAEFAYRSAGAADCVSEQESMAELLAKVRAVHAHSSALSRSGIPV